MKTVELWDRMWYVEYISVKRRQNEYSKTVL